MTYKQIEQAREVRLWITTIVVPVATVTASVLAIPEVRQSIATTAKSISEDIKWKFEKRKFRKVES